MPVGRCTPGPPRIGGAATQTACEAADGPNPGKGGRGGNEHMGRRARRDKRERQAEHQAAAKTKENAFRIRLQADGER